MSMCVLSHKSLEVITFPVKSAINSLMILFNVELTGNNRKLSLIDARQKKKKTKKKEVIPIACIASCTVT